MVKYKVVLYPKAFRDMYDIYNYIAINKVEPTTAKRQTERIWEAIHTLENMPESHQDRLVGRFSNKGYKQLIIDNYIAIYKVNELNKTVSVVTVQYGGRNI